MKHTKYIVVVMCSVLMLLSCKNKGAEPKDLNGMLEPDIPKAVYDSLVANPPQGMVWIPLQSI